MRPALDSDPTKSSCCWAKAAWARCIARDPRLNREVAIKTSREQFNDRFEREARAVAALNHPNICHLYDIGPNYLVMELVEGETLKGPLPVDQVLAIARQVALALEAAHEKGIVHRDLKPANIKITPEGVVKVLDFGLARLGGAEHTDPSEAPTTMASPTRIGTILGTAAYMAPEQARGKTVDKRADIWAFGVVLYEISTGDKLFAGETVSDTLAQVLMKEPDLARLPPELDRIVRWCLEKDPAKRLRDIGDARPFLEKQPDKPTAAPAPVISAAGVAAVHLREQPAPVPDAFHFELRLPANAIFTASSTVVLSPDGRHVTFSGIGPDGPEVFVQDFDGGDARALKGTGTGSQAPPFFWSPDSRYVVFSANSPKLQKVDILTGAVQDICDKPGPPIGGSWNRDDTIIFGSTTTGLWRVPASGGKPVPLTHLDSARQERSHELPMFLPDGRHFLYLANSADPAQSAIYAGSLDDAPGKPRQEIVSTEFGARFVPGRFVPGRFVPEKDRGWLLYLRGGSLMVQPFDTEKLVLTGNPSPLPVHVGTAYQTALFSASPDLLVYRAGSSSRGVQFTWVDAKSGKAIWTAGEPGVISSTARISPDETRVAYAKEGADGRTDIWVLDLARGGSAKLTFGGGESDYPVWSPDGREIAFGRLAGGIWQIFRKRADGTGVEEPVLRMAHSVHPGSWSKDGRFLTYSESPSATFSGGGTSASCRWRRERPPSHSPTPAANSGEARRNSRPTGGTSLIIRMKRAGLKFT